MITHKNVFSSLFQELQGFFFQVCLSILSHPFPSNWQRPHFKEGDTKFCLEETNGNEGWLLDKKGVDGVDSGTTYRNDTQSNSLDWSTRRQETLSRILGIDHSILIYICDDWCAGLPEKCWKNKDLERWFYFVAAVYCMCVY